MPRKKNNNGTVTSKDNGKTLTINRDQMKDHIEAFLHASGLLQKDYKINSFELTTEGMVCKVK